jgi:hypothetical protein
MIYSVYRSKYNKETLDSLRYSMTLEDFFDYKEYIDVHEDTEYASHKDQEALIKK